jgi:hypothetical protein
MLLVFLSVQGAIDIRQLVHCRGSTIVGLSPEKASIKALAHAYCRIPICFKDRELWVALAKVSKYVLDIIRQSPALNKHTTSIIGDALL